MDLIRAFALGSSALIFVPFYLMVLAIPDVKKNLNVSTYALTASIYFGTMSVLIVLLQKWSEISLWKSIFYVNLASIIIVCTVITIYHTYEFQSWERWLLQYLLIALGHSFAFFAVLRNLL